MANSQFSARRLILAGGFAVAVAAAPAVAAFAVPAAPAVPLANCPAGEELDSFTNICISHTVPSSPAVKASPGGLPTVLGVPCTSPGRCIGLEREAEAMAPRTPPTSTIGP